MIYKIKPLNFQNKIYFINLLNFSLLNVIRTQNIIYHQTSDICVFSLNMLLQIVWGGRLETAVITRVGDAFVFESYMGHQVVFMSSLIITLITWVLDTLMHGLNMFPEV